MRVIGLLLLSCLLATWASAAGLNELRRWDDYQVIMWVSGKTVADPAKIALVAQRLKEMGVTAGMVTGDGDASLWKQAGMPYYVENIVRTGLCLKQRSPVTDWSKFVNQWMETRDESAFVRPFCLQDPVWLAESKKQMQRAAGIHKANAPLLYDIRDELSVTTSANPFDYDFSPQSLTGFREWLQKEYGNLKALNKQWDTDFSSWDVVKPFSTDQIKRRMLTGERMPKGPPDDWSALKRIQFDAAQAVKEPVKWNFSPWCDFRTYMDTVLARTLDTIRLAAHEVDSATPVGIEGTQMPHAFGGYDLWKLSQSVDWMEPYDVGCSREILGDFMPGRRLFCTVFEKDTEHALRRLWHLLLLGDKGCIVWWSEECIDASKPDYPLTEKGRALAPVFRELQSPLAKLFMVAKGEADLIAIHYSQASIQGAWLLESVTDGRTWPRRFSSFESDHSRHAAMRNGWLKLLQDLGYTPRFVSTEQIENGELEKEGCRVLVMPGSRALSSKETSAVGAWMSGHSNLLMGSELGGTFDEHGALGRQPTFGVADASEKSWSLGNRDLLNLRDLNVAKYSIMRRSFEQTNICVDGPPPPEYLLPAVQIEPELSLVRIHRYRLGNAARLLAFERGVDYHMSEDLKQAGGNEPLEKPVDFTAKLAAKAHIYDLRSGAYLGERGEIPVDLDPWKPALFALLPEKLPEQTNVVEHLLREAIAKIK